MVEDKRAKNLELLKEKLKTELGKEMLTEYLKGEEGIPLRDILSSHYNSNQEDKNEVKDLKD
ncbi:MAG: hypothetical protein CME71_00370 [Halobacteriovorax sp.]|nr:hypothetical protein [Halobacteriovorax sp.]